MGRRTALLLVLLLGEGVREERGSKASNGEELYAAGPCVPEAVALVHDATSHQAKRPGRAKWGGRPARMPGGKLRGHVTVFRCSLLGVVAGGSPFGPHPR